MMLRREIILKNLRVYELISIKNKGLVCKLARYALIGKFTLNQKAQICFAKNVKRYLSNAPPRPPKYRAVFIGSDNFSLPTLKALNKLLKSENVSVVVSSANNVVSKWAKNNNNRIYLWKDFKDANFDKTVTTEGDIYHIGVVASFGYMIPSRVINRFPLGILNVHASLLPRWRGASPINHSIIYGDTETGVSIMKIAPHRFDVGPVLHKKAIPLDEHIRAPELLNILAELGASALVEVLEDLPVYLKNPIHQDDSLATLAPKLTSEMAEVDWSSKTATEVYRLFRGLFGTIKLRTTFMERRVDLDDIEMPVMSDSFGVNNKHNLYLKDLPANGPPGQVCCVKDNLYVRCATSSGVATWIKVNKLKIGMKWMKAKDFRNGFLSKGKFVGGTPRFYLSKSVVEDKHIMRNS